MDKIAVRRGSVPVFHIRRDSNHIALLQNPRRFAPLR
jgi:hypothetical protein